MNYEIDCLFDSEFYENLFLIKRKLLWRYRPITNYNRIYRYFNITNNDSILNDNLRENNYIHNRSIGESVHKNYISFIIKIGDCIIRKIQIWWKKIYYSPHTKVGKKRLGKSFNRLYNTEESHTKEENKKETDVIILVNPEIKKLKTTTQSKRNYAKEGYFLYQKCRDKIILKFDTINLFNYFLEEYIYSFKKNILDYFIKSLPNISSKYVIEYYQLLQK